MIRAMVEVIPVGALILAPLVWIFVRDLPRESLDSERWPRVR